VLEAIDRMSLSDDLARFPCHLDLAAVNVMHQVRQFLNKIDIPVFRTNTLILEYPLECPQKATVVHELYELQGLVACTSPQEASRMDEL
jgi:hypothetical protein